MLNALLGRLQIMIFNLFYFTINSIIKKINENLLKFVDSWTIQIPSTT